MPDSSLLALLDEVRGKTLQLLDGVSNSSAHWVPKGLQNSILWHAGHCYVVVEWLSMQALGGQPAAPDGWFELFSWESRPGETDPQRWPALADVVQRLAGQHARLRELFATLSEEQLAATVPGRAGRSVRNTLLHALHDEACHGGEIWLLRKLHAQR